MDFTGLNSNPVVFDTTANVRKALPLDEEDDEDIDEVPRVPQEPSLHASRACMSRK